MWKHKTCPDCLQKKRAKRRKAKIEKIPQPELKPIRLPFMSYEDYKRHFPNAKFEDYLKEKRAFEAQSRLLEPNFPNKLFEIPINADTQFECEKFRRTLLGLEAKDADWLRLCQHQLRCRLCKIWYGVFKTEWQSVWKGAKLW